jgi:phage anti-repressor protein
MQQINIVELIENNPITKLSKDYNDKLLTKVKAHFTGFEQQLFLSSFYCYLNRDKQQEFVIDLDSVWQWLDFSQKHNAKILLEKNFVINEDYVCLSSYVSEQKNTRGGHNIKKYMLSVKTFKSFCLKAGTNKSNEIHNYYLKLDELIQETMNEECSELKLQLDQKSKQIEDMAVQTGKEKEQLKETTLLEQFPLNTQCIYIGLIDNKTLGKPGSKMYNETVIKFGQSNNLGQRVKAHKNTYENFRLFTAFKVKNKIEIENCIKNHPALKPRLRILTIANMAYREIIALNDGDFTIEKVEQYIKDVIKENEYSVENYNLLLKKNEELHEEINRLNASLTTQHQQAEKTEKLLNKLENEHGVTEDTKGKIASHYALCKYGYFIYAYQFEDMRFVCSITRQKDYDTLHQNLKDLYPSGKMVYQQKCSYPLTERNMIFILKQNSVSLGQNKFECSEDNVRKSIDASVKLEELLMEQSKDVDTLLDYLSGAATPTETEETDPEIPTVRKAKRSIDKINMDTGEVVATYESIEAAGRSLGLTTGTAVGIALRENRTCKGFMWRYTGISKEQQFAEQPVIKTCCKTGEQTFFKNMADAAKDCKISAPALRRRILTDVHVNNHHWMFDPNASHYCAGSEKII